MERISKIFVWLTFANLAAFAIETLWLGGDAINGHTANGHYFLSYGGQLTEVSHAIFVYSRWHTISLFVMMPIALFILASRRTEGGFAASQRAKNARTLRN